MTGMASPIIDKQLADILKSYRNASSTASKNDNIELEIRLKGLNKETFCQLYEAIRTDSSFQLSSKPLETSINIISENIHERPIAVKTDVISYIRKLIFEKSIKVSDTFHQKSSLSRPVIVPGYIKCSIGLAKESPQESFSTQPSAIVRFKTRISFDILPPSSSGTNQPSWRVDLTAVKQDKLQAVGESLKSLQKTLFPPDLSLDNFQNNLDLMNQFEIEIEHIGTDKNIQPADIYFLINKMQQLVNPSHITEAEYQSEIYHIAEYIIHDNYLLKQFRNDARLKRLSNQAMTLIKSTYYDQIYPPIGFLLTEKADGIRCFVSIGPESCKLITSAALYTLNSSLTQSAAHSKLPAKNSSYNGDIIADCELIRPAQDQSQTTLDAAIPESFSLLLFDCIVLNGRNISNDGIEERIKVLPEVAAKINNIVGWEAAKPKKYIQLGGNAEQMAAAFREIYEAKYPYKIDGLILSEPSKPYIETKNYKWKSYEHTTIDFLAIKCPQKVLGIKPFILKPSMTLYALFVGIDHSMREHLGLLLLPQYKSFFPDMETHSGNYYPVQFCPSSDPYAYLYYHADKEPAIDHKIVEMRKNKEGSWELVRVREDRKMEKRYYGNDFKIAELTYINYIDPFELENLWKPSIRYFSKDVSDIYQSINKYNRFVASLILKEHIADARRIIDLASGRGADLHRYEELGIEDALFIDIDQTAIAELIRRKLSYRDQAKAFRAKRLQGKRGGENDALQPIPRHKLSVHTLVADLKKPHELYPLIDQFDFVPKTVDGIVCNFAFHYLCDTIEHIHGILDFVAKMLRVGGLFIFTVFDGQKVFDMIHNLAQGETWKVIQDNNTKFSITKKYAGNKLSQAGQTISVLLPFSGEAYDEPLCNIHYVISAAKKLGLELVLNRSFITHLDAFKTARPDLFNGLTSDDKSYIDLYSYVILRKVRERSDKVNKSGDA